MAHVEDNANKVFDVHTDLAQQFNLGNRLTQPEIDQLVGSSIIHIGTKQYLDIDKAKQIARQASFIMIREELRDATSMEDVGNLLIEVSLALEVMGAAHLKVPENYVHAKDR